MNPWEAQIPKTAKQRDRKRCYSVWSTIGGFHFGGKVVWLTDKQKTFYLVKYPNKFFEEVLERDKLEAYKKYLDATIE